MTQPQEVLRNYQKLLSDNNNIEQTSFFSMVLNNVDIQGGNNTITKQTKITRRRKKDTIRQTVEPLVFVTNQGTVIGDREEPLYFVPINEEDDILAVLDPYKQTYRLKKENTSVSRFVVQETGNPFDYRTILRLETESGSITTDPRIGIPVYISIPLDPPPSNPDFSLSNNIVVNLLSVVDDSIDQETEFEDTFLTFSATSNSPSVGTTIRVFSNINYIGLIGDRLYFWYQETISVFTRTFVSGLFFRSYNDNTVVKLNYIDIATNEIELNLLEESIFTASGLGLEPIEFTPSLTFEPISLPILGGIDGFLGYINAGLSSGQSGILNPIDIIATTETNTLVLYRQGTITTETPFFYIDFVYRYYTDNSFIVLPADFFEYEIPVELENITPITPIPNPTRWYAYRYRVPRPNEVEIQDGVFLFFLGFVFIDEDTPPTTFYYTTRTIETDWSQPIAVEFINPQDDLGNYPIFEGVNIVGTALS